MDLMRATKDTGPAFDSWISENGLRERFSALGVRWRRYRDFHRICTELQALPDWILRDIGIPRSQIRALATRMQRDHQHGIRTWRP